MMNYRQIAYFITVKNPINAKNIPNETTYRVRFSSA